MFRRNKKKKSAIKQILICLFIGFFFTIYKDRKRKFLGVLTGVAYIFLRDTFVQVPIGLTNIQTWATLQNNLSMFR